MAKIIKVKGEKVIVNKNGGKRSDATHKPSFVHALCFTAMHRFTVYMTGKMHERGLGFRNWALLTDIPRAEDGLLRHIDKYFRNKYENGNDEPDQDHLSGILFNVFLIMLAEVRLKIGKFFSRT